MINAIIFDMDGTIVDTELLWADAIRAYLRDHGCDCDSGRILKMVYGLSWLDIYTCLTTTFPVVANRSSREMSMALSAYHQRICADKKDIVIESSVKLLKRLAVDYPIIVVSGSPRDDVAHNLKLAGVYEDVLFVLGAEDCSAGKPDPAGFLKGAAMLKVPPCGCLVFEDSAAGVKAAKSAGMRCVALSRKNALEQDVSRADLILSDLSEFDIDVFNAAEK